jgi:flagellar motor switch protein FliN/FliY
MAENTENEKINEVKEVSEEQETFSNHEDGKKEEKKTSAGLAVFDEFEEANIRDTNSSDKLEFLKDLQLNVYIELGRTHMQIKDVLELERGYVIELDKLASEPVDIFVNNKKIAEGEVVVIDKHFGIRITNLNEASQRLKGLY